MLTYLRILAFSLLAFAGIAQSKCLNYHAVIVNQNPLDIPGNTVANLPYSSADVCIKFSLLGYSGQLEYEEVQCTRTDSYGLVNLNIGAGSKGDIQVLSNQGKYSSFDAVIWDTHPKKLKVDVSFDQGKTFSTVSEQALNYSAYALYAESVDYQNVRSAPTKLSQFTDDIQVVKLNDLVPIKADIDKNRLDIQSVMSSNSQANNQIAVINQSIKEIDILNDSQNYRLDQLLTRYNAHNGVIENLNFTYERLQNKSTAVNLGGSLPTDGLYPSQKAVKTYIDAQTTVPATATVAGKIQLAGDLTGNYLEPRIAASAVNTSKLADNSVTTSKIVDANVINSKLADNSVTTSKIVDANVTDAKIVSMQTSKLTGITSVGNGGTGVNSITGVIRGNGTGAFTTVSYGSFYDSVDQFAVAPDSATKMMFRSTDFANGVSIVDNTKITVTHDGVYNLIFSAQLDRLEGTSPQIATIWIRKNGVDMPGTAGKVIISGSESVAATIASWNFLHELVPGDYIEFLWSVTQIKIFLNHYPETSIPRRPESPSICLTVTQVN